MIRSASENDIPAIVELIKRKFLHRGGAVWDHAGKRAGLCGFSVSEDRISAQMTRDHRPMFAYEADGIPVGYYSLRMQENNECELNNLAVLPAYRDRKETAGSCP